MLSTKQFGSKRGNLSGFNLVIGLQKPIFRLRGQGGRIISDVKFPSIRGLFSELKVLGFFPSLRCKALLSQECLSSEDAMQWGLIWTGNRSSAYYAGQSIYCWAAYNEADIEAEYL